MDFLNKKRIRILFQLLGIVLFVLIIIRVDIREVLQNFQRMAKVPAVLALAVLFCFTLVKGVRWRTIVAMQGVEVSIPRSFSVYAASLYLGFLTPGRIGDFVKSLYLVNRGMPAGKAIYSSFLDRLFDVIFLAVIGYISFLVYPGIFENQLTFTTLLLGLVVVVSVAFFFRRDFLERLTKRFVSYSAPERFKENIDRLIGDVIGEFDSLERRGVVRVIALTLVAWIFHYGVFLILAEALEIDASINLLVMSTSAAIFMGLIPVSVSGLGTRELVLIIIFERAGLTRETAVAFSFTFILVYVLQGIVGLLCWVTSPFHGKIDGDFRR